MKILNFREFKNNYNLLSDMNFKLKKSNWFYLYKENIPTRDYELFINSNIIKFIIVFSLENSEGERISIKIKISFNKLKKSITIIKYTFFNTEVVKLNKLDTNKLLSEYLPGFLDKTNLSDLFLILNINTLTYLKIVKKVETINYDNLYYIEKIYY